MAKENESPYKCHIFVCTNDRKGERKSCADNNSSELKKNLKNEISQRGLKKGVRVSTSGCMGLCGNGSNVIIYPQKVWFSNALPEDSGMIVSKVEELVKE